MPKLKIVGGRRLSGEIVVDGAKNSAVALIPASILCDETVEINNVPDISDIDDSLPPVIMKNSEGALMYATTDIATILDRVFPFIRPIFADFMQGGPP